MNSLTMQIIKMVEEGSWKFHYGSDARNLKRKLRKVPHDYT